VKPIGFLESCFPERNGTPRQGLIAPHARSRLKIKATSQPHLALEGLEEFSHIWLIFVFHANTNAAIHAKVKPPRLGGKSIGVFATRTPHRPVPIGLSVARLDRIDFATATLYLSGADLVHGTPVLDIKPYISRYDSVPDARAPEWVSAGEQPPLRVTFTAEAEAALQRYEPHLKFFSTWQELREAAAESLSQDIRPRYLKKERAAEHVLGLCIDTLNLLYTVRADAVLVVGVELWQNYPEKRDGAAAAAAGAAAGDDTALAVAGADGVGDVEGATAAAADDVVSVPAPAAPQPAAAAAAARDASTADSATGAS
jgi:tRNA-Thr(GGU) m(6)t(6)A37 methyltransferase TsaA